MPSSSPARYLAPAALVAAALAVLITWAASTGSEAPPAQDAGQSASQEAPAREPRGGSKGEDSGREGGRQPSGEQQPADGGGPDENGVYTVQGGDNIGSIAEENDATVEEILSLNPKIDPQTLQVGDRLLLP